MFKKTKIFLAIIIIFSNFLPILNIQAQEFDPDFNHNYIISQFQMFDYNSMSLAEIQNFLVSINSY